MDHRHDNEPFPPTQRLWEGAILSTIAHAIWVAGHPILAGLQSWDGHNYCLGDGGGAYGAVTFSEDRTVAVFFDLHSVRSPYRLEAGRYDPAAYFSHASRDIWRLAQRETLEYMLFDLHGETVPLVTAACWSEGDDLVSWEPWVEFLAHGGHLIEKQLLPFDRAIVEWQQEYDLVDEQVQLLRNVYGRKIQSPGLGVQLTADEEEVLFEYGDTGKESCVTILRSIRVDLSR